MTQCVEQPDLTAPEATELAARGRAYPLTEFQRNMLGVQLRQPDTCVLNLPMEFSLPRETIDADRFVGAVARASEHHPIFRTVLELDGQGRVMQRYVPGLDLDVRAEEVTDDEYAELRARLNRPMPLVGTPLVGVRLFVTPTKIHLAVLAHHVAMDGGSINAILDSIARSYDGSCELELDTYYTYLDDESRKTDTPEYAAARAYFDQTYGQTSWCNNLKPDHSSHDYASQRFTLATDVTSEVLWRVRDRLGISPNEFCAAAALMALAEVEGERDVMLNWVFSNRVDPKYQRAGGMVIRLLPLGVHVDDDIAQTARQVHLRAREARPHSLCEWCLDHEDTYHNDALFLVYEGTLVQMESMKRLQAARGALPSPTHTAMRRTTLQVTLRSQGLFFRFACMRALYDEGHVRAFEHALRYSIDRLVRF